MDDFKRNVDVTKNPPAPKPDKQEKPTKKRRKLIPRLSTVIICVLLAVVAGGGYYFYDKYNETKQEVEKLSTIQGQQELSKSQTQKLLEEMRSRIVLPDGEDPVIATITDINQLKNNEFYKNAKNDDRVVVFANAKKAYIYRPSTKTIVNVGAFSVESTQNQKNQ